MEKRLPTHVQVVVIGGGIVGCSVAYHLTKLGWTDVVLLERKVLTSGTTWAAAGLVGQLRATHALSRLAKYGTELYARLEEETEQATGYVTNGSIMVARTKERVHEYERGRAMAKAFGIEMERISLEEAKRMWPLMSIGDLEAAYYFPKDGQTNPVDTGQALAKGARLGGVRIFEEHEVLDVHLKKGRVTGVTTNQGSIECEYVVNCGGMWARRIGEMVGASVPLYAAEHMHIVTEPIDGVYKGLPTLRDMDGYIYFREEVGGLLMGGFEPVAKPWGMKGISDNFMFTELNDDWDQFSVFMGPAIQRCPSLETAQVRKLTVVPESFTPDTAYMLGEAPGMKNFFVAAGMNSVGIASAAGVGKAVAEWIVNGSPTEDLWDVDIRRFFGWQRNKRYLHDRIVEAVGRLYADHWPFRQPETSRGVRRSVLHESLEQRGACFGVVAGWERANWFATSDVEPRYQYSWSRQNWFDCSAAEHKAVRNDVGVYDLSSMAEFLLLGRDAEEVIQRIAANHVAVPVGGVVYTQLLNEHGGIESDVTVTRLAQDKFFIVTGGVNETRDFDWIQRHIPEYAHASLINVSSAYAMLGVMGPRSRELLTRLTSDDLSNEAFPYGTAKEIDMAYARLLALRMSYVGELGWELYIPADFAKNVFDELMKVGDEFNLKLVGLHAVDSLRLEKGYKHWGSDLTPDYTPYESGLGFAVKLDKGDFIGRQALMKEKKTGLTSRLVIVTLDDSEPLLYHDEPVYRDGELVATITHGAYAHLLGSAVGMAYLKKPDGIDEEWIMAGRYEVDVEGDRIPAKVHLHSPYDPKGERLRM